MNSARGLSHLKIHPERKSSPTKISALKACIDGVRISTDRFQSFLQAECFDEVLGRGRDMNT